LFWIFALSVVLGLVGLRVFGEIDEDKFLVYLAAFFGYLALWCIYPASVYPALTIIFMPISLILGVIAAILFYLHGRGQELMQAQTREAVEIVPPTPLPVTPVYEPPVIKAEEDVVDPFRGATLPPGFTLDRRFRHQWIVGSHGSGKTTLLSHMILSDLRQVYANRASVFVMDSQNELVPNLARLKLFAPGQPLEGKLIYLEPKPEYPLALNIFSQKSERLEGLDETGREILQRNAYEMVEFFLSSILKMEVSSHQEVMLKYLVPAAMSVPNATILTLRDLADGQYSEYARFFTNLDPEVHRWIKTRLTSKEYAVTLNAIKIRIDGFLADRVFREMFQQPENKFDLFEAMQSSKVIVVNTNKALLKAKGTEAFGRFFIAKLLQATEERMLIERGARLPVYCYIDEATDYIAEEEKIAELIDKARKQRVALILAHQRVNQIRSTNVSDALENVGIKCSVAVYDPTPIKAPPLDARQKRRIKHTQELKRIYRIAENDEDTDEYTRKQIKESIDSLEEEIDSWSEPTIPKKPPKNSWNMVTNNEEPFIYQPPPTDFAAMAHMDDREWNAILANMRRTYCVEKNPHAAPDNSGPIIDAEYKELEIRQALPPPDDGDTNPKPWRK
jgi:GTPase SAR1 family protein